MRGMDPRFCFNDTATTEIYTLSLHDALPIFCTLWSKHYTLGVWPSGVAVKFTRSPLLAWGSWVQIPGTDLHTACRSEEHTSELQSRHSLVCRLLLDKNSFLPLTPCAATNGEP